MASTDWSAVIGTGNLAVVSDADNVSSPAIMKATATGTAKAQYEHVTGGSFIDGGIEMAIKVRRISAGGSSGNLEAFLSARAQASLEDSDRYECKLSYIETGSGVVTDLVCLITRVISSVATTLFSGSIVPPSGLDLTGPDSGDVDWNYWKFEVATDGSTERIRLSAKTLAGSYDAIVELDDSSGSRITTTGKTRFGAKFGAASGATVGIVRMDNARVFSLA